MSLPILSRSCILHRTTRCRPSLSLPSPPRSLHTTETFFSKKNPPSPISPLSPATSGFLRPIRNLAVAAALRRLPSANIVLCQATVPGSTGCSPAAAAEDHLKAQGQARRSIRPTETRRPRYRQTYRYVFAICIPRSSHCLDFRLRSRTY